MNILIIARRLNRDLITLDSSRVHYCTAVVPKDREAEQVYTRYLGGSTWTAMASIACGYFSFTVKPSSNTPQLLPSGDRAGALVLGYGGPQDLL